MTHLDARHGLAKIDKSSGVKDPPRQTRAGARRCSRSRWVMMRRPRSVMPGVVIVLVVALASAGLVVLLSALGATRLAP